MNRIITKTFFGFFIGLLVLAGSLAACGNNITGEIENTIPPVPTVTPLPPGASVDIPTVAPIPTATPLPPTMQPAAVQPTEQVFQPTPTPQPAVQQPAAQQPVPPTSGAKAGPPNNNQGDKKGDDGPGKGNGNDGPGKGKDKKKP